LPSWTPATSAPPNSTSGRPCRAVSISETTVSGSGAARSVATTSDERPSLRAEHLAQPDVIAEAYAASVQAAAAVITALNEQARIMEAKVSGLFRRHPDAGVYLSQPGIGDITGARILGEFGDAPGRYATAKARKNYAGTSPLTIQSGKKKTVHARYIRNRHLIDPLHAQALSALSVSPGARAYYDDLRAHETGHDDAMRRVASRLTGILHGCLKTGHEYDEATAWSHRAGTPEAAEAA
jgi:transposase